MKSNIHKPKTIIEAIDDLEVFLECDLYSKLRPHIILNGEEWIREDTLSSEEEFIVYIHSHFSILKEQVEELLKIKKEKYLKKRNYKNGGNNG